MRMLRTIFALTMACAGSAVSAGPAAEIVFTEGVFLETEPGTVLSYTHKRLGQETAQFKPFESGEILLELGMKEDRRQLEAQFFVDKARRTSTVFPADIGNPLIMSFLESSLRSMATLTDGSPFYIRNRIKDSLRDGGTVSDRIVSYQGESIAAKEVRFIPFAEDAARERMGNFADMELVFIVSDGVPGYIHSMHANTPPAANGSIYFNEIVLLTTQRAPE